MNLARYILRALHTEGIEYFFMVPGKLINPFMSCYQRNGGESIQPIVAAFEGGAAMMADGYARASEKFGVAIVLDGPGTANAVGAIANAYADGSPVLLLAGQIAQHYEMMGALQDSTQSGLNLAAVLAPLTQYSFHVRHVENGPRYLRTLFKGLYSAVSQPAYMALAKDVLLMEVDSTYRPIGHTLRKARIADHDAIQKITRYIQPGSRVAIVAGARANRQAVTQNLIKLSEKENIAIAATVSSKGIFPETHPHYLGLYGYSGHRRAIEGLLKEPPDILILLGFDTTQWTSLVWEKGLQANCHLIQVGTCASDLDFVLEADAGIMADEEIFLDYLLHADVLHASREANKKYLKDLCKIPLWYAYEATMDSRMHPAEAIKIIQRVMQDRICIADSGNHRSFATHYWLSEMAQGFYSANAICGMGWAIPASIGICLARRHPCVVITGDGCMLMHGIEIQTAARYHLDIVYIIFNNGFYGATYFNNIHNIDEMSVLPPHDWVSFAKTFGVAAQRVSTLADLNDVLNAIKRRAGPFVIDLVCSHLPETPAHEYRARMRQAEVL